MSDSLAANINDSNVNCVEHAVTLVDYSVNDNLNEVNYKVNLEDNDLDYMSCEEEEETTDDEFDLNDLNKVIIDTFNQMTINREEDSWVMSETQRGYRKLFSNGYGYIRDGKPYTNKNGQVKQYWKCENDQCIGRGWSNEFMPPFELTSAHCIWHEPNKTKVKVNLMVEEVNKAAKNSREKPGSIMKNIVKDVDEDVLRSMPSQSAIKQRITRKRKKNEIHIKEPVDLKSLVVPDQYKKTYRGKLFLIDDSKDDDRVLLFSTDDNLKLLSKHRDWLGDGTFKILPLLFLQLYSILVEINNFIIPLAFGLLPNKTQRTYLKFFSMLKKRLTSNPNSINVDFEKAVFNAVQKTFGAGVEIYGCYFHLSQNFFKHVRKMEFYIMYLTDTHVKQCFLFTQALAFLPSKDVLSGFLIVKQFCIENCARFMPFLDYVEKYYIGGRDSISNKRHKAYFPINTWNLHLRILENKPRTNNKVERFNQKIQIDSGGHHLSCLNMIEVLRLEQGNTEAVLAKIDVGAENAKNKLNLELDRAYVNVLKQYDSNLIFDFIKKISHIIQSFNEKLSKQTKKKTTDGADDE